MEISEAQQKLRQARTIFWTNLSMTLFSFTIFIRSFDSHQSWKIVCSGAGFSIFLGLTTLLLVQMMKLRKEVKN